MSKSATPNIPGINAMTDTFDFVKNMWGGMSMPGMGVPGMVMPTLSVDEINKQIKDLKAVESWLTLNMNMLSGTIKALEVQSATLSTLQSMSESFTTAMTPTKVKEAPNEKPAFASPFVFAKPPEKAPEQKSVPVAEPKVEPPPVEQSPTVEATAPEAATDAVPPLANPAAWWNMLQDQFKQAVNTAAALTPEMPTPASDLAATAPKKKGAASKKTVSASKKSTPATVRKRKAAPKA